MIKLISGYEEMEIVKEEDKEQLEGFFKKVVPNGVLVEYSTGSSFIFHTQYTYNWDKEIGLIENIESTGKDLAKEFIETIEKQNIINFKGNVQ